MSENFCISSNGEEFFAGSATREDSVLQAINDWDLDVGSHVHTGVMVPISTERLVRGGRHYIDMMGDEAFQEFGDAALGWLDAVSADATKDLHTRMVKAVEEWMDAHDLRPTFWGVKDVQVHAVTQELIDKAEA